VTGCVGQSRWFGKVCSPEFHPSMPRHGLEAESKIKVKNTTDQINE
jgi:hypothetical protein